MRLWARCGRQGFGRDVFALRRDQAEASVIQVCLEAFKESLHDLAGAADGAVVEVEGLHGPPVSQEASTCANPSDVAP